MLPFISLSPDGDMHMPCAPIMPFSTTMKSFNMLKLPCILSSLICLFVKLNRSSLFRFSWGEGVYFWWCYCFKILMRALEAVLIVYVWPQEQLQQIRQIMGRCRRILGDTIYKQVFRDISISSIPREEYMFSLLFSYCLLEGFFLCLKVLRTLRTSLKVQ